MRGLDDRSWDSMRQTLEYFTERSRREAIDRELRELRDWGRLASFGGLCALVAEGHQVEVHRRRLLRVLGRRPKR